MSSRLGILLIQEVDGTPDFAIIRLKVDNNLLTDNGDGSATLDIGGVFDTKTIKATYFATVSSGTTSGTITKPAGGNATLIMDEWGTSTDAILSTMENGKPTFVSPRDASGNVITTTFNTSGDYAFSATPSPAADHAIIFVYTASLGDFLVAETLGENELVPSSIADLCITHRLGIGTASPDVGLHVYGIGANYSTLYSKYENASIGGKVGVQLKNDDQTWSLFLNGADGDKFMLQDNDNNKYPFKVEVNAPSNSLYINSSGYVGLGTTSPDTTLQVVGTGKFGDDDTNYLATAADGELSLVGTARVKKCKWLGVSSLKAPGTKPATFKEWGISGVYEFSDATDDTVIFNFKLPNEMDITVAPSILIGWSTNTAVTSETCVWQLEYLYTAPGEDTTAAAQETLTVNSDAIAQADGLIVAEVTGLDLPSGTDVCVHCRLKRLGADGDDDLTDTVELHGVCFSYTANKLGEAL